MLFPIMSFLKSDLLVIIEKLGVRVYNQSYLQTSGWSSFFSTLSLRLSHLSIRQSSVDDSEALKSVNGKKFVTTSEAGAEFLPPSLLPFLQFT